MKAAAKVLNMSDDSAKVIYILWPPQLPVVDGNKNDSWSNNDLLFIFI